MLRRTEGIVLRSAPYGEADLIVTFLTPDAGIVHAFAKSPRKIKSRFGSSLEPFTHTRLSLWGREDARLPRLTQSDIIRSFQGLREDLGCFLRLSGMAELTVSFLPEGEANPKAFALLRKTLETMEADCGAPLTTLFYKIKLLALVGLAPRLTGCARCGREGRGFYLSQGSILCNECAGMMQVKDAAASDVKGPVPLSAGAVKLHETLLRWDLSKAGRIRASDNMVSELNALLDAHIEYRLSKPLRTKESLASFKTAR